MRHSKTYVVEDEGRDKGKVFLLTEMSAARAESWAMRVLMALMASNVNLPQGIEELGMAALAELGFKVFSGLTWSIAEPLLREMFECVQVIPDPRKLTVVRPLQGEDGDYDIEEVLTRLKLRMEVWNLHTGFLQAAGPSLVEKVKAAGRSRTAASAKSSEL